MISFSLHPIQTLVIAIAITLPSLASAAPERTLPAPRFDSALFEQKVHTNMKNQVKGYAFVIANKDGIRGRAAGGWAQDPKDGNLPMSTKVPINIGSVTKTISGAALLNLLEALPDFDLDTPIFSKLPNKWQQKYAGTRVKECLTYRQLLQHKSGFGQVEAGKDSFLDILDEFIKEPCLPTPTRNYSNQNFYLLRYLIPALAYPQDVATVESKNSKLSFDDYSTQINIDYSHLYERYIKATILAHGLVPISASCRPESELMPNVAKGYSDRSDTKGILHNTTAQMEAVGNYCASQGNWYLSAEMLAHFGRTLLFSNNYLTNTTRNMLFDHLKQDDRIIWSSVLKSVEDFGKQTGEQSSIRRHKLGYS
jgi:Beta-lactamase